jgi:hypothetical protein
MGTTMEALIEAMALQTQRLASLAATRCKGYYGCTKELKWTVHICKLNCWQFYAQFYY